MEKIIKWLCDFYRKVTLAIPERLLHLLIIFVAALFSIKFAVGLAIGRESNAFSSPSVLKDSIGDLIADAIGIALALIVRWVWRLLA